MVRIAHHLPQAGHRLGGLAEFEQAGAKKEARLRIGGQDLQDLAKVFACLFIFACPHKDTAHPMERVDFSWRDLESPRECCPCIFGIIPGMKCPAKQSGKFRTLRSLVGTVPEDVDCFVGAVQRKEHYPVLVDNCRNGRLSLHRAGKYLQSDIGPASFRKRNCIIALNRRIAKRAKGLLKRHQRFFGAALD